MKTSTKYILKFTRDSDCKRIGNQTHQHYLRMWEEFRSRITGTAVEKSSCGFQRWKKKVVPPDNITAMIFVLWFLMFEQFIIITQTDWKGNIDAQ